MNVPISTTIERMEMMMPKMNFTIPNMTSPTMQRAIYPNQATKVMRVEPTAESNLHQVCVVLMFVVICLELNLFAVPGAEGKFSFLHLFVAPFSDIFFASSCRIGRFVSGAFQGRRGWKYKVFPKNTTQRCGDFFENRRLDLLFPKPAAIPLHLHDNG